MNPACCRGVVSHDECGRHSGIPPCCRAWHAAWCAFIDADLVDVELAVEPLMPHLSWAASVWNDGWGYAACPGCRQCGAKVLVRDCDEDP